jgi:hypothetical protein
MERLVLFTKQPANLPLTYTHNDGRKHHPGCGIAAQTDVNLERVSTRREIDVVSDDVWIRAEIVAVVENEFEGVDVFYNRARVMSGHPPVRTQGPGYVRYVSDEE